MDAANDYEVMLVCENFRQVCDWTEAFLRQTPGAEIDQTSYALAWWTVFSSRSDYPPQTRLVRKALSVSTPPEPSRYASRPAPRGMATGAVTPQPRPTRSESVLHVVPETAA